MYLKGAHNTPIETATNHKGADMKATQVIINTMGFTVIRYITIVSQDVTPAGTTIRYKAKGGRKVKGIKIYANETSLTLAKGWQEIEGLVNDGRGNMFFDEDFVSFEESQYLRATKGLKEVFYSH